MMENPPNSSNQLRQNGGKALARPAEVSYRDLEAPLQVVESTSGSGLVEYWRVVLRHKGTVLLLLIVGGFAGFLSTLPETPIYRAHATLEVQGLNQNFLNIRDVNPTASGGSV